LLNVKLRPLAINLNPAVISAALFSQKLSRVSVSMSVIKPDFIESRNTRNMASVINQIPGIDVLDGQASIRGGGGYSYGAGSRVLMLLDGLPLITADADEIKWNFLPIENYSAGGNYQRSKFSIVRFLGVERCHQFAYDMARAQT